MSGHRGVACLAWLLLASPAMGSSLQISPVFLQLPPGQTATSLSLHNTGSAPIYGQVRIFRWSQQNGEDVMEPVDEVVASPPLIRVEPQSDQLIRLIARAPAPTAGEHTYRVVIDELPSDTSPAACGVVIRLRYSVPLFVESTSASAPVLRWQLQSQGQGWALHVVNAGQRHAQLSAVTLVGPGGARQAITPGLLGYALGGQARAWPVTWQGAPPKAGAWRVEATVNAQPATADVDITP